MVSSDVARGIVLVPVAAAGLAGSLPLWGLVVAAALLETATSYFAPAYGATIPTLVDRENVQRANAFVSVNRSSAFDRRLGGRGGAPHLRARERVLRRERSLVLRLGVADRAAQARRGA